ncbi:MAG: FtsW/RodA/SpoVE family cell cycle protein [Bacteroidales bacterium]|nr:FtsW/RodA/SpoVE family cell cycle protein [Bacteroidales bacterium]
MGTIRKYAMLISTLVLCGMMLMFFNNLRPRFEEVEEDYKHDRAINLSPETDSGKLSQILMTNGYVADQKDADFIADTIVARLKRGMEYPNLYHLQKRDFGKVPASVAEKENVLTNKLYLSYERLGLKDSVPENGSLDTKLDLKRENGDGSIEVRVYEKRRRGKILNVLFGKKKSDCKDVVVCLREYYVDSVEHTDIVGYAKTDSKGRVVFKGLNRAYGYSVLPLKAGCEYGSTKGVVRGIFDKHKHFGKNKAFEFEQLEHRIPMIDNLTLRQIKNDGTITVRTPQEFKTEVIKWFVLVLLAWWMLMFIMFRRRKNFDIVLIATVMFLTELCVIVMYSIQNPLTEELRGTEMAKGVLMGVGVVALFQLVDFVGLYQDKCKLNFDIPSAMLRWLFLSFKKKVAWLVPVLSGDFSWYKKLGAMLLLLCFLPFAIFNIPGISKINKPIVRCIDRVPKGFGWLLLALLLTALLWTPLGREIGGMKVNLSLFGLTFQPSEIAKYLILLFLAAFFTQYADTIIAYSQPNRTSFRESLKNKVKTLGWVIAGLLSLMFLYAILGDMGPGLVIGVTFVLLYSLVKSKVNLDNLEEDDKWKRIFTCDFAMLIYGVVSFAVLLFIGYKLHNTLLFAVFWFLGWIIFGIVSHKQFFETAFIINLLVFMFVFGGDVMKQIPGLKDTDLAERFEQRTRMCSNTWGDLDIHLDDPGYEHGKEAEPVSNTQVANGLWAIATGGMTGQGLGDGNPNLIPAFHTDMILSSIGEQMGWIGLLIVVLVFAMLLRRIVVIGYRVGHPFAFYFCLGVAIVTAVQFFIIALGSSGMIPLTGITVPFLSYGRVSMILNLAAIGIVLSLTKNIKQEELTELQKQVSQRSVGDYDYPVSIVTLTYTTIAVFTLLVWQYYALWARGNTLVKPAYVLSDKGLPMIEYNPRIALLTKEMWAGDIHDRNGLLLATSDQSKLGKETDFYKSLKDAGLTETSLNAIAQAHTKRYYPFAEHLFFMIGDQNTGLYFSYNEDNPIGYMAEAQYLSYLRNYDNLHDKKGRLMPKVRLHSNRATANNRYLNTQYDTVVLPQVRDYHKLVKYLKAGIHGRPLKNHNKKVQNGKYDLQLTLDAKLQRDMQNKIAEEVKRTSLHHNNLLRISVVVLDAENGDLLTSANYPLPDHERLRNEEDAAKAMGKKYAVYSDNCHLNDKQWTAYTDRDLGLTYQTQPGSTAKVMSAMAGFMKFGFEATKKSYMVYNEEKIDTKLDEPTGMVSLHDAIVQSSNCYFVNSVNDMKLYKQLGEIYKVTGVRVDREIINDLGQTVVDKSMTPYFFYMKNMSDTSAFNAEVSATGIRGAHTYTNYIDQRTKRHKYHKMNWNECAWAWGQGTLRATPLNMARVASIVVNNGTFVQTRYLLNESPLKVKLCSYSLEDLKSYMKEQAKVKGGIQNPSIGGKTGTPERSYTELDSKLPSSKNDAWYIFFVDSDGVNQNKAGKLAVAVRIERAGSATSGLAMQLTREQIIPVLIENGYLNK